MWNKLRQSKENHIKRLIAIVGPTAVGKSKLALYLAQIFNGEIVNADSRQVYRYMDIGTAKPSPEDRALIPHHLIDIVNPDETFSLAIYIKLAFKAIKNIQQEGKLPFLVGGSGLYAWSVIEGWRIPQIPPDYQFRGYLEEKARKEGYKVVFKELEKVDPEAARKVDPCNVRRVIRALEIYHKSGIPASQFWRKEKNIESTLIIGLTTERKELYQRINNRVDEMIRQGLIDEVKNLLARGYSFELPSMSGIGYKQIGMFLRQEKVLSSAIEEIKYETHRFARHQYAWFRLSDKRIYWLNLWGNVEEESKRLVEEFITKKVE